MYSALQELSFSRFSRPWPRIPWHSLLTLMCLVACHQPGIGWCDTASDQKITSYHKPMRSSEIPPMGHEMQLRVVLQNTSNIETNLRLVGSKDGKFIDLAFPIGTINYESKPEFTLRMPAPFVEMSYQIVVHQPDGSITTSKQFFIQRACLEDYQIAIPENSKSKQYRSEVAQLVGRAKQLEDESHALEQALSIIEGMKSAPST